MRISIHRNPLDVRVCEIIDDVEPGPTIAELLPGDISDNALVIVDTVKIPRAEWGITTTHGRRYISVVERAADFISAAYVVQFLIAAAVSYITTILFPPPGPPKRRDDNASATYSFGGIGNNRFEGLPIPVPYGTHRIGGQIINEWIDANSQISDDSFINMQIALGEGSLRQIAGQTVDTPNETPLTAIDMDTVELNGNAIENFDEIEGWVRMGSVDQEVVAGFHKLFTPNTTGLGLLSDVVSGKDNSSGYLSGDPYTTDWDAAGWDEYGVAFDITDEVDGAVLRITFPQGLFSTDNSGALETAYLRLQFRYIELDGSNNPITTGGPNNDGYVRETPTPIISSARRDQFSREFDVAFLDPQTWTQAVVGKALVSSTGGYARAPVDAANNPYYDGAIQPAGWTASVWMRLDDSLPTSAATDSEEILIFGNYDATLGSAGIGFQLAYKNIGTAGTPIWVLQAKVGGAGGAIVAQGGTGSPQPDQVGEWYMLTLAYEKNDGNDSTNDRIRLYLNDTLIKEKINENANFELGVSGTTRDISFLRGYPPYTTILVASLDDAVMYDTRLGTSAIVDRFGLRRTGPDHPNFIARWKFDDLAPAEQDVEVGGLSYFDEAAMLGTATSGVGTGIVEGLPGGTAKQSKYRIEVLRLTVDSDNTRTSDAAELESVNQYLDDALSYPDIALLSIRAKATEQLNTSEPTVTTIVRGRKAPVWDGLSTSDPVFVATFTANPAWIAVDMLTNRDFGLGEFFSTNDIDVVSFGAWADYCDEVVYDGSVKQPYDTASGWGDINFDSTAYAGRGVLTFLWDTGTNQGNLPPSRYVPLSFVRVHGIDTVATFDEVNSPSDSDPTGIGGYEVAKGTYWNATAGAWAVDLYWDRPGEIPWTDGGNRQSETPWPPSNAWIEGGERRFEFNGVFDEELTALDALKEVSAVGRGSFYQVGTKMRVRYQSPRTAVTLLGRGSIEDGSFKLEYTGPTLKPNAIDYSFLDRAINYEKNTWPVLDPSVRNANSAVQIRKLSSFIFGVTSRAQIERHGNFILNANRLLVRSGRFQIGIDGVHLEIGDVFLIDHDLVARGVGGRLTGDQDLVSKTTFQIDHPITIESGTTYKVYLKDWRNHAPLDSNDTRPVGSELEVATLASPGPGTYEAGQAITVTGGPGAGGGFTAVPKVGVSTYNIVEEGQELMAEIVEISLSEGQLRDVRWVEYQDAVYDDAATPENITSANEDGGGGGEDPLIAGTTHYIDDDDPLGGSKAGGPGGASGAGRPRSTIFVPDAENIRVRDYTPRERSGSRRTMIHVTWRRVEPFGVVLRTEVLIRTHVGWSEDGYPLSGEWRLATTVGPRETSAEVDLPSYESSALIQVAVRHVSLSGAARAPHLGSYVLHTFKGANVEPRKLRDGTAVQEGELVRYGWELPRQLEEETVIEIRRGGWVLGQRVYTSPPNEIESPPIEDWAGAAIGGQSPDLLFAARDLAGNVSDPFVLSGFEPSPPLQERRFPMDYAAYAWETWGDGWVDDTAPPTGDPALTDLERHADGYLQFSGATTEPLIGYYTTFDELLAGGLIEVRAIRPSRAYVEATVIAEQVHPLVWGEELDDDDPLWGGPESERWTWEGPRAIVREEEQVTLKIQWRRSSDGNAWDGGWVEFKPGVYELVFCQFRLIARRPDATYDLRIQSFSTRVRVPREREQDRSQARSFLETEMY